jgi:hypothetical protein
MRPDTEADAVDENWGSIDNKWPMNQPRAGDPLRLIAERARLLAMHVPESERSGFDWLDGEE